MQSRTSSIKASSRSTGTSAPAVLQQVQDQQQSTQQTQQKQQKHLQQGERKQKQTQHQRALEEHHFTGKSGDTMTSFINSITAGGRPSIWTMVAWGSVAVVLLACAGTAGVGHDNRLLAKCTAEFVGTFLLVFSVGCNVLAGDPAWAVVSIASTLMVAIYALGPVSGGHFNPAVTTSVVVSGKMKFRVGLAYVFTQLAAGLLAGLFYARLLGQTFEIVPADGYTFLEAGMAEMFYTGILCFAVLNTAVSRVHAGRDQFYGLAIGFSVIAGGYGAGSISGGCFNPAVAMGANSITGCWGWFLAYLLFQISGSCLAAICFRGVRPNDFSTAEEFAPTPFASKMLGEFLGTYVLVLTVGLNVLAASPAAVLSIASALVVMVFSLGSVSGAHFNPAVTFAVYLSGRRKIEPSQAIAYVVTQVVSAILAGVTYILMMNGRSVSLKPSAGASEALFGELIFTFLLCLVVLSVGTVEHPLSQYYGLAIGFCVTAGGLAIGSLSGGSLNPAVSSGIAISDILNGGSTAWLPSYVAVELVGAAFASLVFRTTHTEEYGEK